MAEAVAIPARRGDLERRVEEIRFLVFGRSLPAVLFALLGLRVWSNLTSQVHALGAHAGFGDFLAGPVTTGVYLLFCIIPVGIYLIRPRPRARDGRVIARTAGLVGTTMLLVVGAFPNPVLFTPWTVIRDISAPLALGAFVLAVYGLLYLRRSSASSRRHAAWSLAARTASSVTRCTPARYSRRLRSSLLGPHSGPR